MANIDTTIEIEKAYIKDKLTYKKKRSKKTTYFYTICINGAIRDGKFRVALVYPFNYNATPWTSVKPEFNISWGDGTETVIRNKYVDMFSFHYDKFKPYVANSNIKDIKLFPVPEKSKKPGEKLLYHEYDIRTDGRFAANGAYCIKLSIESDEIVMPISLDADAINNMANSYTAPGTMNLQLPFDENTFGNASVYSRAKKFETALYNCIASTAVAVGGEYPMNCIGLPTEEYRNEFTRVFERGIFHPLDQKIEHIKNGVDGIDEDIISTINTNDKQNIVDYKSPGSMSMYALAGNNRFVNKELLESIGTPNQHPIPIQAYLCSGSANVESEYYLSILKRSYGIKINPLLTPALINKGVHINNSLLRITVVTGAPSDNVVHTVMNPYRSICKVYPNSNGEYKLFSNMQNEETWGFFCNFYSAWRYQDTDGVSIVTSPWLYDTNGLYDLFKSIPEKLKSMKCIYKVEQWYVDDKLYGVRNEHKLLDAIPKTVEEIENLVVFSNLEFYKKGFRVYRNKEEYDENEAYNGGFRMLPFDNDDGVSTKYKNSNLKTIKNMVFCCDLYPEPLRLGDNAWTTNFDGVSLLYGFNNLEKVDGVFTYCRFKDTGYMRIRDICQRPQSSKYEDPTKINFKPIELSRVMHWCDVINELAEDGDTNEAALNPFNGAMRKKQRNSWNITPNYKYRDFFNKMNNETSFNPDKAPTFIFGKQENDTDFKHMGFAFMFLGKESYPNDRLGGMIDQTPIFKSVTDFSHGYMMSYSYINCEVPDMNTKTIKIDGYLQQFLNHMLIQKFRFDIDCDFTRDRNTLYLRNYINGLINLQWLSPIGWMYLGKTIDDNKLDETTRRYVKNNFKPAVIDMSNMEGLFANIGALSCDLTPMNEINDIDLFLDFNSKVSINGNTKDIHIYTNRFGLYSYNEDDILIKSNKDVNIKRIFQNETYYGALTTDNFFQGKSRYLKWFGDLNIYRDNELNKLYGFEHNLAYNMTSFKEYENLRGSDYKDRIVSMGLPRISPYDIPVWSDPNGSADEFLFMRHNSALGSNSRFKSATAWAHDDNLINWIVPPMISGYKYRYPTLYEYINAPSSGDSRYAHRFTMNTQYPRAHQGANFLLMKGRFIFNDSSSTNADYAFDGMILHFGLNKAIVHKDVKFNSIKGITTKNTIGVIKHNCDWNFKDESVVGYIPTISRPFNTVVVGEPFTNLKHIVPKRIVPNIEEFNEMVALRINEFNSYERYPGRINSMIVPKIASTPARYRKFDNVQYKFKSENVELEEFNYMPHNVVDYTIAMPNTYQDAYDMVFGVSHVRKLFPNDVNVHIKNFKMPYVDNINKFKMLDTNFDITKDKFIMQTVPLDYALNGATVDNIEELRDNWNYKGTATIFKSAKMIDGPLNQTATVVLRCPYNVDLSDPKYNVRVFVVSETDWGREKVIEQNLMVNPQGPHLGVEIGNPDLVEFYKVCDTTAKYPQDIKVTNFQPPLRCMMRFSNLGTLYQNVWPPKSVDQNFWSVDDRPGKFLFPRSSCDQHTSHVYAQNTADENFGGTSRWVNQLPKEIHKCVVIRKFADRMEFDLTRKETEFSILVLADIPLWMEGSDYITGEFPPYSDYSEKYPEFKRTFDADWFKTQCYDKQMKGFEIDDVFLEVDDHMRHTMALMQIDNNDLNIPHRVNPHILEPTTRKGQTKFGEVITAYGRKFPIVNFRWTLGFAFDNLPKTVTEVEGFNFADTVYVPDKCVPAQITKFHFHKELLEPNQAYKQGIIDAVLWLNKPFMSENIQTPGSVEYFSNIMLFTRRKDSLSNGARTQMEEYYEWSTDNKITLGPNVYNEGYGNWKDSIRVSGIRSDVEMCLATHIAPEPNYYEMRRNYNSWVVADRNVKPDDIITVKWVIRFQSLIALPIANTWVYDNNLANLNPYISGGVGHFDMSEDTVTYTGKAKDLINFGVFDIDKLQSADMLYRQNGLPTIKSIRIYSDVYVCPSINWERGIWGVLRGTLPPGTDTRCVPIPQKCYEGIFYRDVKLHGIITGEYDGSLPEKLFWGTRKENLRIQGLYCSTRYANPHSWRTRKTCIRKQLANNTSQGDRYQINNLSRLRESGKVVTDNLEATLNNIYIPDSQHNVYNRITGNNLFVSARAKGILDGSSALEVFPMVTSDQDSDYRSLVDDVHNIQYSTISDQMIKDNPSLYPKAMFYYAGFADRFDYIPSFRLHSPVKPIENETEYSLNFSRGAFSNVHDASPLSIPHKIDELDVSYLGGFADLFEVYTDDVFGFTEPNLYNLNYPINMHQHQEYAYTGFKYPDHENDGGLWNHYIRPSYQAMPVSSFFSKWFFLNGTIRVKDNSEAYVFSDHRIGNITDFDGYSPHRFDQTTFDQSIYAVQHENVRRSKIYKINNISLRMPGSSGHFYTSDYMSVDNNYYNKIVKPKLESSGWYPYCVCTAVTHGGFGSIERYSRSSVYYPSNMISETVGAIDQTGYVPIMSSLMKLNMLKSHRDLICRTDTAWYSTIPFECMVPQGYMNNWAVADDNTMKCRAYFSLMKKMRDFPDVGIMVPPKWYKDHQNNNRLPAYVDRFKYIEDIQNNKGLLVSTTMCEPSKNMMFRMNGKRRIKARYGRLRFVEIGNGWTGMDLGDWTTQPYDIIYPRAIPGIVGIYHYVNSAYRGRITNMRNLCHWACYGFNYGLIDDTGMTQYLDIGRELFIESETGFARNQMLIGCHPHLKEVKIINAACSEMSNAYNDYYDTEKLDPDTNVKLHLVDESQHPSFLQTSPNCIIKETLPYQPCLTKIKNMCSSPLFLTVGNTSLTHILNYGSRIMHGRKYGKSPTVWSYLIGEEQKVHSNANVMRTCIWPTYKKSNYVWTPSFTLDPSSQVSSYVDVIVDPKWVNRTMYARQDLPKEQQTPYQGIKIQGMFMGVWNNVETTAFGGIPGVEKSTNKFWDRLIPGIGSTAYRVNYSSGRALEYGVNEIINLHTRGITRRGLWNVPMQNWGKGVEQISLPTTQFLRSNSGLPGPANFRASGNPKHHPDLKVFLTHTFAEYWFATVNPVDLYTLCDSTILTNNGLPDPSNDGIIVADDYRFLDIYGQPFTITYGNQSPVVYAKSQRGWIRSPDNLFYLEGWDMSTNNLLTNTNKTLIRLYEADSDITDFYSTAITRNYNHRPDMVKQSYYAAYTNPTQALQKFEESVVSFVKPSYPPTAVLNITNAFNGIRFRWFNYDLSKPGYSSTLAKYKFNVANYVRDNFDRIFFNGKVNIIGKSGITS
jgi:hypothetical protein